MSAIVVCALYRFTRLEDFKSLQKPLLDVLNQHDIRGTLLLANEGINGTVAGSQASIDALLAWFDQDARLAHIEHKLSFDDEQPFYRTKVKLKKEIVTMGVEGIDPKRVVGTYVKPKDWNELINQPDVVLVDTRNDYEVQIGTFQGALNPNTETFREFPEYVAKHLNPAENKRVAMFCTGGIRCEKSTAYLKEQGFEEVYHLEGGILKYLEEVPAEESTWEGECFVFDNRVAVDHSLEKGSYDLCHGCRMPITEADKLSAKYEQGVSCHHCYDELSDDQRERFRQRELQLQLAKQRGLNHIGDGAKLSIEHQREKKRLAREAQREKS
jgi:UPF0176 protein